MTDKQLRKLFRKYNSSFFDNQIEEPDIIKFEKMTGNAGHTSWESQKPTVLRIHSGLIIFEKLVEIVLLHEMAHLKIGYEYQPHHGMRWQAEINRLLMAGAYEELF